MTSKLPNLSSIDITPLLDEGTNLIISYSDGGVKINNQAVLLSKNIVITKSEISEFIDAQKDLDQNYSNNIIKAISVREESVIIIGINDENLKDEILTKAQFFSKPLEVMSIKAACRTYNVLISEDRDVACILVFG